MQIIHRGKITNQKVVLNNEIRYLENLKGLEGKEIELTIKEYKKDRSIFQNRYYWSVVLKILADYSGNTGEEMHEVMKQKFLGQKGIKFESEVYFASLTTTTLNTKEFEEYLEKIRRWALEELGVMIPLPNEVDY